MRAELLHQHPLLQRLTTDQVERFSHVGELELFHPGEDIVIEGTLGDSFYLLLSGVATVHSLKVSQPLATIKMGDFFGEMSLLEPVVRSATVRAAELCEVFRVTHFNLANFLGDDSGALGLVLAELWTSSESACAAPISWWAPWSGSAASWPARWSDPQLFLDLRVQRRQKLVFQLRGRQPRFGLASLSLTESAGMVAV